MYQIAFDLPGARRVRVVWNADGASTCARIARNGTSVVVLDKRGAGRAVTEQNGSWILSLDAATAHFPDDPDGYYFIGGSPLVLEEDGVSPAAPVSPPVPCNA
jgi:hypothetical protein